jgi:hypothetical protein
VLASTFSAIGTTVVNEVVLRKRISKKIRHHELSSPSISLKPLPPLISEPVSSVEGS